MTLLFDAPLPSPSPARRAIRNLHRRGEAEALAPLLDRAALDETRAHTVLERARTLAGAARARLGRADGIEGLFDEYDLSTDEGVLLMCLAEALLRIPDAPTQERLIRDKLARGQWDAHLGRDRSVFVNASTWGLLLTGRLAHLSAGAGQAPAAVLRRLAARLGENLARRALLQAMGLLARHFVAGAGIRDGLRRRPDGEGVRYSYDCLGEAARGPRDVERYFDAYREAVAAVAASSRGVADPLAAPGVSVKLSALHPRFEHAQRKRVLAELVPRLLALAREARDAGLQLTVDAEEADRLELTLDAYEAAYADASLSGWEGLGLAVQAYQKRAPAVLAWLAELGRQHRRRMPVRLVKGAYWDGEIKRAQQLGLDGYPVYTRKHGTDVCYLACARYLLANPDRFYPQLATHDAYTIAYVLEAAGNRHGFEFQRLHGMGEAVYEALAETGAEFALRVYAPVGSHEELLPYLVRRLLENAANPSFIHRLADPRLPVERLVVDPVARLRDADALAHPRIPLPVALYAPERTNSRGLDLADPDALSALDDALVRARERPWRATAVVGGREVGGPEREIRNPSDRRETIGLVREADAALVPEAFGLAADAQPAWDSSGGAARAERLDAAGEALEAAMPELAGLIVREGGRTLADAVAEVREAVDACRYYAARARREFAAPERLPGPTGESNELWLRGRGVFACISPWNFPVAIFTGQVAAALAAGNAVVAKPARQTPLAAAHVIRLLHGAGIPADVLHFLPGSGGRLGNALLADPRLAGVAFTGSTETAWTLQQRLAERRSAIVPLIAETGGQNALIADSSALAEQLVPDVIASAFDSAGQRCSALRVLFVQTDIADRVLDLLADAMGELTIGDPVRLSTDIGPVIDDDAVRALLPHDSRMRADARVLREMSLPPGTEHGSFFAPRVFELDRLDRLDREVFGPILHVIRYEGGALDRVIDAVNATGYGLTLGVHSRIESTWQRVRERARAGNVYVNRNMIGAVVGVQPFGGEGLSGTGPKAGGPHYLRRFAVERAVTVNTVSVGGNTDLLSLED